MGPLVFCLGVAACGGATDPASRGPSLDAPVEMPEDVPADAPGEPDAPVDAGIVDAGPVDAGIEAAPDVAVERPRDAAGDSRDVRSDVASEVRSDADVDGADGPPPKPELDQVLTFHAKNFTARTAFAPDGSIYIAGAFAEPIDFDPTAMDLRSPAGDGWNAFLTKLNADGSRAWTRTFGDAGGSVAAAGVTVADGAIFLVGTLFKGPVDFDPGPGVEMRQAAGSGGDTFVARFDADGNFVWVSTFTGDNQVSPGGPAVAGPDESLYVAGSFFGSCDFDPGPVADVHTTANSGGYVVKLGRAKGDLVWSRVSAGETCFAGAGGVALGPDGNLRVVASASGGCRFLGMGWPDGQLVTLLASLSPGGSTQNIATFDFRLGVQSIAAVPDGSIYLAGGFTLTVDFDPGPAVVNRTCTDDTLACGYVLKLGADSKHQWVVTRPVMPVAWIAPAPEGDVLALEGMAGGPTSVFQVERLATDSTLVWSVPFRGMNVGAGDLATGPAGFAISGWTQSTLDVDPGRGNANVKPDWAFWARYRY